MGDPNLVVNWSNERWKINNQIFRTEVQKTQNLLDKRDIRRMSDHMDVFQCIYRDWKEEADHLTHEARQKRTSWNSLSLNEEEKLEAVRVFIDGQQPG